MQKGLTRKRVSPFCTLREMLLCHSDAENRFGQGLAALRLHDLMDKVLHTAAFITVFGGVGDIVRLQQNLIVLAADIGKCVICPG